MVDRRWIWISAIVVIGGVIFWAIGQSLSASSADTEFRKTTESLKQVKSFRGAYTETASTARNSARLWEVDCSRTIVHQHSHDSETGTESPYEMRADELLVGNHRFMRDSSGSWEDTGYAGDRLTAKWYCDAVAQGNFRDPLPDMFNLISHGITEKRGKKTVNGVRCQEWKFDMRTAMSSRVGSICIGVDDHLPYEMTMDGGQYLYSDYNQPIQFEAPETVLQPASPAEEPH